MPALIWTVLILMMLTSSAVAGACSEDGLRYFTKYGVSRAYFRFHELIEEARCRKEPEFLVNLAQMYKSGSNDGATACRALLASMDAWQSPELSPPYPRAEDAKCWTRCKAFAGKVPCNQFFTSCARLENWRLRAFPPCTTGIPLADLLATER